MRKFRRDHSLGLVLLGITLARRPDARRLSQLQRAADADAPTGDLLHELSDLLGTSYFWNQTLQNWQSEFLAIGVFAVATIYLRQRGSTESKPVGAAHAETGA